MNAPKIEGTTYDATIKAGVAWRMTFRDDGNGTTFVVRKDAQDHLWIDAENEKGKATTGQVRPLRVESADDPGAPEPNRPPQPVGVTFRTRWDTVLYVESDGRIRARAGEPTLFEVRRAPDGRIGLSPGGNKWVTAESDGRLTCTRVKPPDYAPEAWEAFKVVPHKDSLKSGTISLQSDHGRFVAVESDGTVIADRPVASDYERLFPSPPLSVTGRRRAGIVRNGGGGAWVDDDGEFHPLGGTLMWAPRGWKFERERYQQNILSLEGFDFQRILGEVGWDGNDIQPDQWSDYDAIMAELIDWSYDEAGKRTMLTVIGGGTSTNYERLMHRVVDVVSARPEKVLLVEVCNEWDGKISEPDLMRYGQILRAGLPNHLVACSTPSEEVKLERLKKWVAGGAANAGNAHFDRADNTVEGKWKHVRKPWESRGPSFSAGHLEPGGPRSSVAEFTEPMHLVLSRLVGIICGYRAYVLHNGAGVRGQVDPAHNRPANIFEVPDIAETQRIVRALDGLIPPSAGAGLATRAGFAEHPFVADAFWAGPDGSDHGVVRDYANVRGDGFVQALLGIKGYVTMTAAAGSYNLAVIDPITGASETRRVPRGGTTRIESKSVDSRGLGGLIVVGRAE
jgi:hypothetical protein